MSADNAVAILITQDTYTQPKPGLFQRFPEGGCAVYRVAHISNPESFAHYAHHEVHNLGHWMAQVFAQASCHTDKAQAQAAARALEDSLAVVEYGIVEYDARPLNFPEH